MIDSRQADEALDRMVALIPSEPFAMRMDMISALATVRSELGRLREELSSAYTTIGRIAEAAGGMQAAEERATAGFHSAVLPMLGMATGGGLPVTVPSRQDKELWIDADEIGKLERSIQYERDQVRRLTEGLREIADARVEYRRDGHGHAHHLLDKEGNYLGSAAPKLQEIARALLSASPSDGGGAK